MKEQLEFIKQMQAEHGYTEIQNMINSGDAWRMEGSYVRAAMALLECGACVLPEVRRLDYYGNSIPARQELKDGSKGTIMNSINYYNNI